MQGSIAEKEKLRLFKQQQSPSHSLSGCVNNKPKPSWDAQLHTICSPSQSRTGPAPSPHPQVWLSLVLLVLCRSLVLAHFTLQLIHRHFGYLSILRSEEFGHICIRCNNKGQRHPGLYQEWCGQQEQGGDHAPVLGTGEAAPGVLCSVLSPSLQKGH